MVFHVLDRAFLPGCRSKVKLVTERAKLAMPEFFAGKRLQYLQELFNSLDADMEGTLSVSKVEQIFITGPALYANPIRSTHS